MPTPITAETPAEQTFRPRLANDRGTAPLDPDEAARFVESLSEDAWESGVRILAAAKAILEQGEELLRSVAVENYTVKVALAFNGSIGGHYRHCLDHFTSLLRGLDDNLVDYDHRERDARIETDPSFALRLTRSMRAAFDRLTPGALERPVDARCEVSYVHGRSPMTRSTFGRELVYGIAHAIHHYALIAVMARLQGAKLPEHFGIAPSTVAHHQSAATGCQQSA